MTKTILSFIGGFIIGLIVLFAWNTYTQRSVLEIVPENTTPEGLSVDNTTQSNSVSETDSVLNNTTPITEQSTAISVRNQDAGTSVLVASAMLSSEGWVVVHEEKDGHISNALGASYVNQGTHTNIVVPLLRETQPSARYWIVLYSDNGDRQFNLKDDFPLRDAADAPVTSSFLTL